MSAPKDGDDLADWDQSAEGIHYRLGLDVGIDDDQTQGVIVETITRLPRNVAEYAIEQCRFVSVGRANLGITLPGRLLQPNPQESKPEPRWLIVVEDRMPAKWAHSVVAHEIAHAWLKHDRGSPDLPVDCEVQAATLTGEWGFTGRGADVAWHRRQLEKSQALNAAKPATRNRG